MTFFFFSFFSASRLKSIVTSLDKNVKSDCSFMTIPGPSYPTPSEVNLARESKCDIFGMTSLAFVSACRSIGIEVFGIAEVAENVESHKIKSSGRVERILSQLLGNQLFDTLDVKTANLLQPKYKHQVSKCSEKNQ